MRNALFSFVCLLTFSTVTLANETIKMNAAIVSAMDAVVLDVDWLENNFNYSDSASWKVLADIHIKCKWLEKNYTAEPVSWCFQTHPGSTQSKWINYLIDHRGHFSQWERSTYMKDGLKQLVR